MGLKLSKLPDRVPVKLTILVSPDLNRKLSDYAEAYEENYGEAVSSTELIPPILESFLSSDRAFSRRRSHGRTAT